ncbi:MAG: ATP-binding protein [Planctomycetota bacterium]
MTPAEPTREELLAEVKELRKAVKVAERSVRQAQRLAATSEAVSTQSKRAMLRTHEELQQTVKEQQEAKAKAEAASHSKGRFLATMSHEMRTPMNGILGSLEILVRSDLDTDQLELVQLMHRSTTSLLRIVNDVLDFSKIEANRLELDCRPFPLDECVQGVVDLEAGAARAKGIELRMQLDPDLPKAVVGDQGRLRQVLLNLVDNAVKFTQRGFVRVSARRGQRDGLLDFVVADTGIGIGQDALSTIFDAFTQEDASTTRRFGGTGLGLAICKRLVQLMGGDLSAASSVGRGTVFTFTCELESANEVPASPEAAQERCKEQASFAARVLVVDDNATNRVLGSKMLQSLGCDVDCASDGAEAYDKARAGGFDVILMDCSMPVMDGYQATQAIRALDGVAAKVPIIAVTAYAMSEDRQRCLDSGMDDYLAKPVRLTSIEKMLATWLGKRAS